MLTRLAIFFSILLVAFPASAQWQPNGLVLSGGGVSQGGGPQLAADGSGGAFVTWGDLDPWHLQWSYAMAQALDPAGNKRWLPSGGKQLCASSDQGVSVVVTDGSGGAIFVWLDNRNGYFDVFAQRINAAGAEQWGACGVPVRVLPIDVNYDDLVAVPDGSGGVIIVWSDARGGTSDIYAQHLNASGTPLWTVNGGPVCVAPEIQADPLIVADGLGGAWIAWLDNRNGDSDVFARHINAAGTLDGPPTGLAICTAIGDQSQIDIAPDEAGGMIIVWEDPRNVNYDVYAQRVSSAGTMLWTADGVRVTVLTSAKVVPDVASDGSGGAIIVWKDLRNFPSSVALFAQRLNGTGQTQWLPDGNLIAYAQNLYVMNPAIISDGNGKSIVAWNPGEWDPDLSQVVPRVRVQRLDANGAPEWAQPGVELRGYTGFPGDSGVEGITLVSDGWGGAIVAWQDWAYWQASDVRVGHVSPGGVATDITPTRGPSLIAVDVYPNPFSGSAKLAVELTTPSHVEIDVFDVAGRKVRSFSQAAGGLKHVIDLNDRDDAGQILASGVYFCRVRAATGTVTRKIVIAR